MELSTDHFGAKVVEKALKRCVHTRPLVVEFVKKICEIVDESVELLNSLKARMS